MLLYFLQKSCANFCSLPSLRTSSLLLQLLDLLHQLRVLRNRNSQSDHSRSSRLEARSSKVKERGPTSPWSVAPRVHGAWQITCAPPLATFRSAKLVFDWLSQLSLLEVLVSCRSPSLELGENSHARSVDCAATRSVDIGVTTAKLHRSRQAAASVWAYSRPAL